MMTSYLPLQNPTLPTQTHQPPITHQFPFLHTIFILFIILLLYHFIFLDLDLLPPNRLNLKKRSLLDRDGWIWPYHSNPSAFKITLSDAVIVPAPPPIKKPVPVPVDTNEDVSPSNGTPGFTLNKPLTTSTSHNTYIQTKPSTPTSPITPNLEIAIAFPTSTFLSGLDTTTFTSTLIPSGITPTNILDTPCISLNPTTIPPTFPTSPATATPRDHATTLILILMIGGAVLILAMNFFICALLQRRDRQRRKESSNEEYVAGSNDSEIWSGAIPVFREPEDAEVPGDGSRWERIYITPYQPTVNHYGYRG
ncbi:hypothetical protein TWF281_003275 [Arthrobotrys megalospora]